MMPHKMKKQKPKPAEPATGKRTAMQRIRRSPKQAKNGERYNLHSGRNIIPRESVAGQALAIVIAIMAFLACLTIGAVSIIDEKATGWQSDIGREVTIQIRPFDEIAMEEAVRQASRLVLQFDGITKVSALDADASARLLEPWLGSGLDLTDLPVPRLLTVSISPGSEPDFAAIRSALAQAVPGASLDDHRAWSDRLRAMAWTMVAIGIAILALVLTATVLIVIFATRGAMTGNRAIVDVLHFVGADGRFIAGEFQRHFLRLAIRGAITGGVAAALVFLVLGLWAGINMTTPQADQMLALFGTFSIGWKGYAGIVVIVLLIAMLCAGTSRFTVMNQVGTLERAAKRKAR